MAYFNRRQLLAYLGATGILGSPAVAIGDSRSSEADKSVRTGPTVEEWMDKWMKAARLPVGALHLSRFADPIYFLTKPITWKPNSGQEVEFQSVTVPVGFVTDFASVPRIFWSLLRPDGIYTYPAIVHDYLYWTQTRSREVSDKILLMGMEDFGVGTATTATIYEAVRAFGSNAWSENARLKTQGEKRVLKRFPEDDPTVRWEEWKKKPDVFE